MGEFEEAYMDVRVAQYKLSLLSDKTFLKAGFP